MGEEQGFVSTCSGASSDHNYSYVIYKSLVSAMILKVWLLSMMAAVRYVSVHRGSSPNSGPV